MMHIFRRLRMRKLSLIRFVLLFGWISGLCPVRFPLRKLKSLGYLGRPRYRPILKHISWPAMIVSVVIILVSLLVYAERFQIELLPAVYRGAGLNPERFNANFTFIPSSYKIVEILSFINFSFTDFMLRIGTIVFSGITSKLIFTDMKNVKLELEIPALPTVVSIENPIGSKIKLATIKYYIIGFSVAALIVASETTVILDWDIVKPETSVFNETHYFHNKEMQIGFFVFTGVIQICSLVFTFLFIVIVGLELLYMHYSFIDKLVRRASSKLDIRANAGKISNISEGIQLLNFLNKPASSSTALNIDDGDNSATVSITTTAANISITGPETETESESFQIEDFALKFQQLKKLFAKYSTVAGVYSFVLILWATLRLIEAASWLIVEESEKQVAAFESVVCVIFIWVISCFGQFLHSTVNTSRRKLQDFIMKKKGASGREKELFHWISSWKYHLTAYRLFTVNRKLITGVIGTVLTNFLVLLQLRFSEAEKVKKS